MGRGKVERGTQKRPEGKEEETEVRGMGRKPGSDKDRFLSLGTTLA